MLAFISVWGSKLFNVFIIKCKWLIMGEKNNQKIEFILKQLTWNGHFYLVSYVFVSGIH